MVSWRQNNSTERSPVCSASDFVGLSVVSLGAGC